MSLGHGASSVVRNGLVLYLDAGNSKSYPRSGTAWSDLSGNNYTGTMVNGPTFDTSNNGSIVFDGTNDYVDLGSPYYIASGNPFTVNIWFKNNWRTPNGSLSDFHRLASLATLGSYALGIAYVSQLNSGYQGFYITAFGGWPRGSSNYLVAKNIWGCLTLTYNGSGSTNIANFSMYWNNSLLTFNTSGLAGTIATNTNYLGIRQPSDVQNYQGNMGIVQIYNRVLSLSELQQNFDAIRGRCGI